MKTRGRIFIGAAMVFAAACVQAQFSISPLSTFSPNNDGWLAPGEVGGYTYLGTGGLERGLAYYSGHLYLVSRNGGNNIRVLNAYTGADLNTPLNTTGISGGTFAVNMVGVGGDGAIYVGNLASPVDNAVPRAFKVYRWANEGAAPTTAFSSSTITAGRMGDNFDVIGSGTSTLIVAGESSSAGSGARNGYAILNTADGINYGGTLVTFVGTPPLAGDFRLGITFTDSSHVIGTQTGVVGPPAYTAPRYTTFSGSSGTLLNTPVLSGSNLQVIMDYTVLGGIPLLATQSSGDSTVRIWDFTNPNSPALLGSANNTTGTLTANGNAAGQMAWGDIEYDSINSVWKAKLWTMSSNQGIQAFIVTVPEPSTVGLVALGGLLFAGWQIRRRLS